ncbi:hypothetical protein GCM10010156_52890 [Planobispora rosea]|uniref:Uncharacterized protein n=1 Tax=Planobispora rosea TaxID=35762 RepID=A0A8J3S652_PLARO|nr:hypothetical protein [Planobispora rosea]GGS87783.1 hypothetical protein GCM10010156_52890 [Planobispora rosea]GIH86691.1 hypothetical protein Pro02_50990 [Planobispora rosea]
MTAATEIPVPYVLAYSGEAVTPHLIFAEDSASGGLRLSHRDPRPRSDWHRDILLARVRTHRRGQVMWRMLNRRRQQECMTKRRCQVCAEPAADPDTGRIWWVITETGFRASSASGGLTNAPPTCLTCIPESLQWCPQLRKSAAVYTVGGIESVGVLADLYEPGPDRMPVFTGEHNVFVGWDEFAVLPYALATQMVVRLLDMTPAEHVAGSSTALVAAS